MTHCNSWPTRSSLNPKDSRPSVLANLGQMQSTAGFRARGTLFGSHSLSLFSLSSLSRTVGLIGFGNEEDIDLHLGSAIP